MGTWSAEILGNDSSLDVYQRFFELYNNGQKVIEVNRIVKQEFESDFRDYEDAHNTYFGLAFAQWETKSLEEEIYTKVKEIIESGKNITLWKELEASESSLKEREQELQKFLALISKERPKKKRRVRPKFDFQLNDIVNIIAPDNKKEFGISEELVNGKYTQTGGVMTWFSGGGSGILYFVGEGKKITASWIDTQNLEIRHEKGIKFHKKEKQGQNFDDIVRITYVEE